MVTTGLIAAIVLLQGPKATESFDAAKSWQWLQTQCSLGPRYPGSKGHFMAKAMLLAEMKKHLDDAWLQDFRHIHSVSNKPVEMSNILGTLNWKDAEVRVLLSAHWDTRPTADQELNATNAKKPIVGANDGASGVAVLLELMRVIKQNPPKGVGIMFAFWDGEDLGPGLDEMFLGAEHFAKKLPTPKPDYGILLDMIGDKDLRVPVEPNSLSLARELTLAVYAHADSVGLAKTFPREIGPEILDDHLPLNRAGIPTLDLIDFDYTPWHTLGDTPDKCSAESLGKVGRLLETWLRKDPPFKPRKRG